MKSSRRWLQKITLLKRDAVKFGIQAHIGQTRRRHIPCLLWNPGFITMFTKGCHWIPFAPVDSANTLIPITLSSIWILSSCLCIRLWSSLFPQSQLQFCISNLTCVLTAHIKPSISSFDVFEPNFILVYRVYFTIFLTSCPNQNMVIHYYQLGLPPPVIELQSNECFHSKGVLRRDSTSPLVTNIWKADRPQHCNVRLRCVAVGSRRRTMTFDRSNPLHQFATHNQQNVP